MLRGVCVSRGARSVAQFAGVQPGVGPGVAIAATVAPRVRNDSARNIYELHVRDFSCGDEALPAELLADLRAAGVQDVLVVNRTPERARALAEKVVRPDGKPAKA